MTTSEDAARQQWQKELDRAQQELEHVTMAIRSGSLTPTTKTLLEDRERRVAECEAMLRELDVVPQRLRGGV